ncbi:MAG: ABC transporter permease [Candidatus Nanopelagicales bacterium]|nr:ABC transporter permease [Candidatus Nanopelagicales bacterium]MDZ4250653.1 ABC transporter permease [Candidatus Nanopelagicales bacterium]MDZ7578211.1 ABC transporter permease [Candidatus Nanopelagicales bacterium]
MTHRRTLALLTRQDIKSSYDRFRLGILWTLAEPFLFAVMMWFVFTYIFGGVRVGLAPMVVYLVTGLYPFTWLGTAIRKGPKTFTKFDDLLLFSPLPVMFWPMRWVLLGLSEFLLSFPVIAAFVILGGKPPTWGLILFPVAMALQFILCMAFAMIGAALAVNLPDVAMISGVVLRMFFWLSPIFWATRDFPSWFGSLLYVNPFYGILGFYRASLWPDEVLVSWTGYATSFGVTLALFVFGLVLLRSRVDEIRRVE